MSKADTGNYKVPTNLVKIPDGDTGYNLVKKGYNRFIWTWNNAPMNQDDDYEESASAPKKLKYLKESEHINGGLSSGKSLLDIAEMHGVSVEHIESQLYKGIKVEMEHTNDSAVAEEIAKDHLVEDPDYYTKLAGIESDELDEYGEVNLAEVPGMGSSDSLPGGTVGYKSGPLSSKFMMPSDWYVDPDDKAKEERELKNLKHFSKFFNK